jgi:hypothetical protein
MPKEAPIEAPMLAALSKQSRIRAALTLALLYAACILAPAMAFAMPNSAVAHCFAEDIGAAAMQHRHDGAPHLHGGTPHLHDGTPHLHDGAPHLHARGAGHDHTAGTTEPHGTDKHHPDDCCGLFSTVAIPASGTSVPAVESHRGYAFAAFEEFLHGRVPERLIRPPIS